MNGIPRRRRIAVAASTLLAAALLFRSQIAEALVVRGDDYFYRNRPAAALERYRRALAIAPSSETAADRFVFVSMERHTAAALRAAVDEADAYLVRNPDDATLLNDRGLCYLLERRYGHARRDLERSAALLRTPQAFVFAGWAARRSGDLAAARRLWRQALRLNPRSRAAQFALAREGSE